MTSVAVLKSEGEQSLRETIGSLKSLMIEQSLPLWAGEGFDPASGRFVERLDPSGHADWTAPLRVRVQARQIWCFAKAAKLGWYPQGRGIALKGLSYLLAKAKSPDRQPGFVHVLAADGSVADARRDTYDQAFILLALAAVYQLDADPAVLAEIDQEMEFVEQCLKSPQGGFIEGLPPALPRRQNPQMHLFEAMIALFDATQDPAFLGRAGELFKLFVTHLFDAPSYTLGEYFEEDWALIMPGVVEPGHQAEWVWLLNGFERVTGFRTARFRALLLYSALRYRDEPTGCLVDEGNIWGEVTKATRRCWPQTEIAKAWIAQAEAGDADAREQAGAALRRLRQHYLAHPVAGGWYDQFDGGGRSLVDLIPASTFYHVLCAVAEAERVLA